MKSYTTSCDSCGWSSNPCKTPATADYALRRHSCDKQRAKDASARRAAEREAAIDRTPKPCLHKRTTHVHGTHACYVLDRCKCPPCTAANSAYERTRAKLHAYGRWDGYTDAQPARKHLAKLRAQGMGLRTIGKRAGVSESTLGKIVYGDPVRGRGPSKRIRPSTEAKILAVTSTGLDDLAGGAKIDGTGTRRRLRALVATGWTQPRLAEFMGMATENLNKVVNGNHPKVEASTARTARDLYNRLWNVPPMPRNNLEAAWSRRVKALAAQRGWVPPLAWDDEEIDNPAARPHATNRVQPDNRTSGDVMAENVRFLLDQDPWATRQEIAQRLGLNVKTLDVSLRRAGRGDLLAQLARNAQVAS